MAALNLAFQFIMKYDFQLNVIQLELEFVLKNFADILSEFD